METTKVQVKASNDLKKASKTWEAKLEEELQASTNAILELETHRVKKDEEITKGRDLISELETKLANAILKARSMEFQVNMSNLKVKEAEVVAREAKERAQAIKAKAQAIEMQVTSAGARAVKEYKKSKNFEDDVIEGIYDTFQLRFVKYKKKVAMAFSEINLDGIIAIEPEQEEGEAKDVEKVAKEAIDARDEEVIIQETITKVIAEAEAMIDAAVKAFEVGSTSLANPAK